MPHFSLTTLYPLLLFLSLSIFAFSSSDHVRTYHLHAVQRRADIARPMLRGSGRILAGDEGCYGDRLIRNLAEQATNSSVELLAADVTTRKDPLNDFKLYTGGWNITSQNYWASVGFTAVPFFALSVVWFVVFGITLCCLGICCCCCRKDTKEFSIKTYTFSIVFLVILLLAAIAGSTLLYLGDARLNNITIETFNYIVERVDMTARKLMELSDYLVAAKNIDVESSILPGDVRKNIDNLEANINATSYMLGSQTLKNSVRIEHVMTDSGLSMNLVAAVMLALLFIGLLFSILGFESIVYILVIFGWILVTSMFISCGVFLLFHNAIADTCIAMNEWVEHPTAKTAMDHITPCVDKKTAEDTLAHTKNVTYQLVIMVNGVLTNISNTEFPPIVGPPTYFNQSGPKVPLLCNPYNSDLSTRACASSEVNLTNASTVWKKYTCEVSSDGVCTTEGRLTPDLYKQNVAAANVSFGLDHYGPFLVSLGDCTFIRETLDDVTKYYCPGLMRNTEWIYIGSVLLADGVMISIILWMVLARQSKRRARNNQS